MKSIFWGAVIIAIGLVRGDSVFRGDFGAISIFSTPRCLLHHSRLGVDLPRESAGIGASSTSRGAAVIR